MNEYINNKDFDSVGLLAQTCSFKKLNQAIEEAYNFDITHIFEYGFVSFLQKHWKGETTGDPIKDQIVDIAINGGAYIDPVTKKVCHTHGMKRIWVYYAYSKYVLINQFDDTPVGLKYKESQFSGGVGTPELNNIENKYKNMGKDATFHLKHFLCSMRDFLPEYDSCGCKLSCGCLGSCSCTGKPHKITGFKYKVVER